MIPNYFSRSNTIIVRGIVVSAHIFARSIAISTQQCLVFSAQSTAENIQSVHLRREHVMQRLFFDICVFFVCFGDRQYLKKRCFSKVKQRFFKVWPAQERATNH